MDDSEKLALLFVCTGNAGRSQMAQALFGRRMGDAVRLESAGVDPWPHLHPMAVATMAEQGISLDGHYPKPVAAVAGREFDLVVTIGDPARALLPRGPFSATYWAHWDIGDPADADGTPDSQATFRATARMIEERLPELERRLAGLPRLSRWAGRPGIGTGLWAGERFAPDRYLPVIREAGFDAIELNLYKGRAHFDWEDRGAVRELRQAVDDQGMLVWSVHAPDLGSVAAADAAERQRQVDVLKLCLELAGELGARAVVSHALLLGPFAEDADGCEERLADFLAELAGPAEAGIAQLAFENAGFAAAPGARTDCLLRRLDDFSRAAYGFALDTGHANLDGDLGRIEATIGDRLASLHLNDNDGKGDAHLAPGEGTVDWGAVRRLLEKCDFRGVLMYEVEAGGGDPAERLRATVAGHRRLLESAA